MSGLLIASPVSNRAWCLEDFMFSLFRQDFPKDKTELVFLINDSHDHSEEMLRDFHRSAQGQQYRDFKIVITAEPHIDAEEHAWPSERIARMVRLRNRILREAVTRPVDFLFEVDTDVILQEPKHLTHLSELPYPIISPVFWAKWNDPKAEPLPNVWKRGQYEVTPLFLQSLKEPGHVPVGGLGAATWIQKEAWVTGLNYDPISNLPSGMWGEDRNFCLRASVYGFGLTACTCYPVKHLDHPPVGGHS